MKITAGIASAEELKVAAQHGASEVYCGVIGVLNHRPPTTRYNFSDLGSLARMVASAHRAGIRVYFLANELYDDARKAQVILSLGQASDMGVDGFIVRDLSLLREISRWNFKKEIILSSLAIVLNGPALNLFRSLGVRRVVLPQHLYPREVASLRRTAPMDMETFFRKEEFCPNIDGLCQFHDVGLFHPNPRFLTTAPSLKFIDYPCRYPFRAGKRPLPVRRKVFAYFKTSFLEDLHTLHAMGVEYLKIKRYGKEKLTAEMRCAQGLLALLRTGMPREEFVRRARPILREYPSTNEAHEAA